MTISYKKGWVGSGVPLTKLRPPRLGKVYVRERLFQQLDDARARHSVIWIAAPAGAGKTTLVASYLQQRGLNALWYQVDAGDQDSASFFYYFGLAAKESGARKKLPLFTAEYQLGLAAFTRNWFRALFAQRSAPTVLVLDNYQDVGDAAALHTVLQHAAEELPAGFNLVVISRAQSPAELARLEAANAIAHIGWEQLQLTADESAGLVHTLAEDTPIANDALQRLHQRTQGWITGVVLGVRRGLLAAVDDEPPGRILDTFADRTQLFDYFAAEVLARTDSATREFLYAAALLPTMTVALCEALTQHRDAKAVLRRLERESFFTTRRGILSVSYEFHPLFRQFLLAQGEAHFDPARLQSIRGKAGHLLAEAGESEHAVALLSATADWPTLAQLIRAQGAALEKQGRHQTLQQWIAALPENERLRDPWLLYWEGVARMPADPFVAYELFEHAFREFQGRDDAHGLYWCWAGATMALFFRHDDMHPVKYWIEELERLRARHPRWPSLELRGRVTTGAFSMLMLGLPQHPALAQWRERTEKMYRFLPIDAVRCMVGAQLGMYYSFFGEIGKLSVLADQLRPLVASPKVPMLARLLANAILIFEGWQTVNDPKVEQAIDQGLQLAETSGVFVTAQWLYGSASMAHLSRFRLDAAAQFIERVRGTTNPRARAEIANYQYACGWLALSRGQFEAAKASFEAGLVLMGELHIPGYAAMARGGLVQTYLALGDLTQACLHLDTLRRESAESCSPMFTEFYCNYLDADLRIKAGDHAGAVEALQKSFFAAARRNWMVNSCWERDLMTRLCVFALQNDIEPAYVKQLVASYGFSLPAGSEPVEQWPYPIKIYTLGRFSIVVEGATLAFEGRAQKKTLDLLKALIACGGRDVSEQRLCDILWPDAEADDARNNFKITLHRLRKLLAHDVIQLSESKLTLDAERCWVDVWSLERGLNRISALTPAETTTGELLRQSEQALRLYHGSFLQGEDASFVITLRERLRGKLVRVIAHVAEHLQNHDQHELAQRWYERGIELEPLIETFYQGFMRTCQALRHPAAGLAAYERCCAILAAQLRVAPSPETEALRQALLK